MLKEKTVSCSSPKRLVQGSRTTTLNQLQCLLHVTAHCSRLTHAAALHQGQETLDRTNRPILTRTVEYSLQSFDLLNQCSDLIWCQFVSELGHVALAVRNDCAELSGRGARYLLSFQ